MRTRVSALFVRRYWQPRDEHGRFLPDHVLWQRKWHHAKDAKWIWWPTTESDCWPGPT